MGRSYYYRPPRYGDQVVLDPSYFRLCKRLDGQLPTCDDLIFVARSLAVYSLFFSRIAMATMLVGVVSTTTDREEFLRCNNAMCEGCFVKSIHLIVLYAIRWD